ncbi:hypothetical protein FRC08_004466 [Ceratobasidium sp. 394]|nr:hypothetical protein FRC08_004466 [Ceratobasidium sp. 394]
MKNWNKVQSEHLFAVADVWTRTSATHDVAGRVESWCLLRGMPFIHCIVPDATLRTWFVWVRCSMYWGFKANRMMVIIDVLNCIHTGRDQLT